MKDLITTIAAISILMVFVLQFSANQIIITRVLAADQISDSFGRIIKEQGYVENSQRDEFALKLAGIFGCEKGEVIIADDEKSYNIRAPIKNVIACGKFLGISDEENKADYNFKGELK